MTAVARLDIRGRLGEARRRVVEPLPLTIEGKLTRVVGLTLEAVGCRAAIGSRCDVLTADGRKLEAEVVGFSGEKLFLMPAGALGGIMPGAPVIPSGHSTEVGIGASWLGRVVDGTGRPLDGFGPLKGGSLMPLHGVPLNPLARKPIREPLDVGVRAINALFTVGRGQRIGLFAGSGVGKSVLLGMMTRYTEADVVVVGLIGERGREVKDFIESSLGPEGMRRACVIAAPADDPPLKRLHGALLAHAVAEYFRDQGLQVLLLMDSLTRYAQAIREIALSIGEPPATRGYPPSVFARIPALAERAGTDATGGGAITAFYTVLAEGDDLQDPVADAVRATLDGHIVLSRRLAEQGHFPAIDPEASISRLFTDIAPREAVAAQRRFRGLYSMYEQNRDLIQVGAYAKGSDPRVDEAILHRPSLLEFLRQDMQVRVPLAEARDSLEHLVATIEGGYQS